MSGFRKSGHKCETIITVIFVHVHVYTIDFCMPGHIIICTYVVTYRHMFTVPVPGYICVIVLVYLYRQFPWANQLQKHFTKI